MEIMNMDYEKVLKEQEKNSNAIEILKEREDVKKYLELCGEQQLLEERERVLHHELLVSKQRKALVLQFQNMCYDYDIAL